MELLRCKLDQHTHPTSNTLVIWGKQVPIKVLTFIWRATIGRIPTTMTLMSRGITLSSSTYGFCVSVDEQADHLLVTCPFAAYIREKIFKWCDVTLTPLITGVTDLVQFAVNWERCPKKRRRFIVICYGLLWGIWKFRNDRIFQGKFITLNSGVEYIKSMTFLWIKHRGSRVRLNWDEWSSFPISVL